MRRKHSPLLLALWLAFAAMTSTRLYGQSDQAIRQVITDQQNAWNRGDVVGFMKGYDDSPRTTFIGKTIQHGYAAILARYQKTYASKEAMGQLQFSELQVRMLGPDHAVATGHFHLARSAAGGGDAAGIFSLVFERKKPGWKIILDHTSS